MVELLVSVCPSTSPELCTEVNVPAVPFTVVPLIAPLLTKLPTVA